MAPQFSRQLLRASFLNRGWQALRQSQRQQQSGSPASFSNSRAAAASAAALTGLTTAAYFGLSSVSKISCETPAYVAPPRFRGSFADLPKRPPSDGAGELAWAVKHLEVERVRSCLEKWPHGAALIDKDDNTLFHIVASEPSRYSARPSEASEVMNMLLQKGWAVVDQKNVNGERAELVAARLDAKGVPRQLLQSRSRTFSEHRREEEPLQLVGETSPKPWEWNYMVQDDQHRSFAAVGHRAFDAETCRRWFKEHLEKGTWNELPDVPRKVAWYVDEDFADTPYRYSGLEYPAVVFPPFMQEIREELCKLCGIPEGQYPNSCNVNIYNDHTGEVGWHSDDEVLFQGIAGDTCILSLSLGAARDFCWRFQGTTDEVGRVSLGDGDVMTMEGLFQKHYKHSVPVSDTPCGPRINMTFRWIKVKAHAADAGVKAKVI
eukprot:TRINITY_DN10229_c0_g1_i1.p1 TRINITY_DN10229_c0_g1~~TRINITY_DN10229_c0_g1_i1.p1  ORF type:complete len:434 (-),score=74.76 TRINITY_DN10229_c0_g1_i1:89-1390(-)